MKKIIMLKKEKNQKCIFSPIST